MKKKQVKSTKISIGSRDLLVSFFSHLPIVAHNTVLANCSN